MNLGRWLIHLYPADWRQRYGSEFLALLDARPLTPADLFDIVFGAWDARGQSGRVPADARLNVSLTPSPVSGGTAMMHASILPRTDRWRWLAGAGLLFIGFLWLVQLSAAFAPSSVVNGDLLNGAAVSWILLLPLGLTGLHMLHHRTPPRSAGQASIWPRWTAPTCMALIVLGLFIIALHQTGALQPDLRVTGGVYHLLMIVGAFALGIANLRAGRHGLLPGLIAWAGVACAVSWIGVMVVLMLRFFTPEIASGLNSFLNPNLLVSLILNAGWCLGMALWLCAGDWLTRRARAAR